MGEDMGQDYLEPGAIDATRRNLGQVDSDEAARMAKLLGGKVLRERSVDSSKEEFVPVKRHFDVDKDKEQNKGGKAASSRSSAKPKKGGFLANIGGKAKAATVDNGPKLPVMSKRELNKVLRLMMSSEYGIRVNWGPFNFIQDFLWGDKIKISRNFIAFGIKGHLEHLQHLHEAIVGMCKVLGEKFSAKVETMPDLKYKFVKAVCAWDIKALREIYGALDAMSANVFLTDMIDFERALYKIICEVYYIGEQKVPHMLKEIVNDAPIDMRDSVTTFTIQAGNEWTYLYQNIARAHYPVLLRICADTFEPYPDFYKTRNSEILAFLGLSKFDILLQIQPPPTTETKGGSGGEATGEEDTAASSSAQHSTHSDVGKKDSVVTAGLAILDKLFPQAGFDKIEHMPDLYAYFATMYGFPDGYNMLAPSNPMVVVLVLLEIIEDLFRGIRNIKFNIGLGDSLYTQSDDIASVLNEWISYREEIYDRNYNELLKNYVNTIYTQEDYPKTLYGKRNLSNIFWQAKYYFLPHYTFERLVLDTPNKEARFRSLYIRTNYMREVFTELARRIDKARDQQGDVVGIENVWEKYKFDVANNVSKRLDVLLGAKKKEGGNATNASLLKWTLCIMAVLDWWINNEDSPAYGPEADGVYRVDDEDKPVFAVDLVRNQNKLFIQAIKDAAVQDAQPVDPPKPSEATEATKEGAGATKATEAQKPSDKGEAKAK